MANSSWTDMTAGMSISAFYQLDMGAISIMNPKPYALAH